MKMEYQDIIKNKNLDKYLSYLKNIDGNYNIEHLKILNYLKDNNDLMKKYLNYLKSSEGELPTTWASMNGHIDLLKYMVEIGCSLHTSVSYKTASCGQIECLKYIRELNLNNKDVITTGRWAISNGDLEMVKYLVENDDSEKWRVDEHTLRLACICENLEIYEYLIEKGYSIDKESCIRLIDKMPEDKYPISRIIREKLID